MYLKKKKNVRFNVHSRKILNARLYSYVFFLVNNSKLLPTVIRSTTTTTTDKIYLFFFN